jgi:hypothetical protein
MCWYHQRRCWLLPAARRCSPRLPAARLSAAGAAAHLLQLLHGLRHGLTSGVTACALGFLTLLALFIGALPYEVASDATAPRWLWRRQLHSLKDVSGAGLGRASFCEGVMKNAVSSLKCLRTPASRLNHAQNIRGTTVYCANRSHDKAMVKRVATRCQQPRVL